jgi:nitrogen fixation NifU-like protein
MDEQVEKKYVLNMLGKYNDIVIDHARNPRNVGNIPEADGFNQEEGECGDTLAIWLSVKNNRIDKATFWTDGCGASIACGSMVTELAKNHTVEEAFKIEAKDVLSALEGLPEDHLHCADLAAHTLKEALKDYQEMSKAPWKKPYSSH